MARAKQIPFIDPEASLFVHAAVAVGTRVDEVIAFEHVLNDVTLVTELHEMRIAAKRLRYTMDLFTSAFEQYSRFAREYTSAITEIKLLQEHLGTIHDCDVMVPRLLERLDKQICRAYGKDRRHNERVGVHLADLDACQGVLTLAIESRQTRDNAFEALQQDWSRMQSAQLFDNLRKTLRAAVTDETLSRVLHEPEASQSAESATAVQKASMDIEAPAAGRAKRKSPESHKSTPGEADNGT